jgi:hypothetical protein
MVVMSKMMISCDKASYLTSKSQDSKLTLLEKLKLKMHLLSCKYCQRYEQEINMISTFVDHQNKRIYQGYNGHHLSKEDKQAITELIKSELNKN